jgi:hypothetical protein
MFTICTQYKLATYKFFMEKGPDRCLHKLEGMASPEFMIEFINTGLGAVLVVPA